MNNNLFGDRLRDLRGTRKKAEFARFLGVDAPAYQRYEDGMVPRADCLCTMAQRAGVSVEWLIGANHDGKSANDPASPHDTSLREPPPTYRTAPAAPPQPPCRFPADCDLSRDLSQVQNQLATLSAQVDTLTRLLGATLASGANGRVHDKQKAG
jgi:transcriptional regulator with XRE-family HTH domain